MNMDHSQSEGMQAGRSGDEEQVRLSGDAFFEASVTKDGKVMGERLHENFVFISPKAIELRRGPFINNFVLNPGVILEVFEPTEQQISIVGDTALAVGLVKAKFKDNPLFNVRFSMTYVRQDGDWKLL